MRQHSRKGPLTLLATCTRSLARPSAAGAALKSHFQTRRSALFLPNAEQRSGRDGRNRTRRRHPSGQVLLRPWGGPC